MRVRFTTLSTKSSTDDKVNVVLTPFNALLAKAISGGKLVPVTYTFEYQEPNTVGGTVTYSKYKTQAFTGILDEDELANKYTTAAASSTKVALQFTAGELDVDKDNYKYYLVDSNDADFAGATKTLTVQSANIPLNSNGKATITGATAEGIYRLSNNDVLVVVDTATASGYSAGVTEYKIITEPVNDKVPSGSIEVITQAFKF